MTAQDTQRVNRRQFVAGVVTSDKMNKTIVVQTTIKRRHAEYGKVVVRHAKLKAHDEENKAKVGDRVIIQECRPLSRDKRWVLVKVNAQSVAGETKPGEKSS